MKFFSSYVKRINCPISQNELVEKFQSDSVSVQNFDYQITSVSKNKIQLNPYSSDYLCYNSFMPHVQIEFEHENSAPKALMITFEFVKSVKRFFRIFECLIAIFQTVLAFTYFADNWHISSLAIVLIPFYLIIFLYLISYCGLRYSAGMFIKMLNLYEDKS